MGPFIYNTVAGRGLLTQKSIQDRINHLKFEGFELPHLWSNSIDYNEIQHNIESLIGSVEIPIGLVGPLAMLREDGQLENVYAPAGTLEGALVASMNRGAKAISLSGGFMSEFLHQRMVRVPLFFLQTKEVALSLAQWILTNSGRIREVVESYSNHAKLIDLDITVRNTEVHVGFVYTTGDASGQNMTTTCTWHGIMWIKELFPTETTFEILDVIIEGNGSSDKKVSEFLISEGRGCKVIASCDLEEKVINRILRTSSDAILKCYGPSSSRAKELGMLAFNINVANAIAAIFVATGQDLASIHESSMAQLNLEKSEKGLRLSLTLSSLVIGTIGGGTHLDDRQDALKLMKCQGSGKIERFARMIAGFALSLEISTYAAIVSGEFAKAHEKLGRNKPVNWLTRAEVTSDFIRKVLTFTDVEALENVKFSELETEKGILTLLAKRVNKKFTGFIPVELKFATETVHALLKNKPTDAEVLKGLQLVSASVNSQLAQLIVQHREHLEYSNCHVKELTVYRWLSAQKNPNVPRIFGVYTDEHREINMLCIEDLSKQHGIFLDTENTPEIWTLEAVNSALRAIASVHESARNDSELMSNIPSFDWNMSNSLYRHLAHLVDEDYSDVFDVKFVELFDDLVNSKVDETVWKTVVHNDFNPRNVALQQVDTMNRPMIYDWELVVQHYPQRDVIEFLSFVADNFTDANLVGFLHLHHEIANEKQEVSHHEWLHAYRHTILEFIFTRCTFYVAANVVIEIKFAQRILKNALRILKLIDLEIKQNESL